MIIRFHNELLGFVDKDGNELVYFGGKRVDGLGNSLARRVGFGLGLFGSGPEGFTGAEVHAAFWGAVEALGIGGVEFVGAEFAVLGGHEDVLVGFRGLRGLGCGGLGEVQQLGGREKRFVLGKELLELLGRGCVGVERLYDGLVVVRAFGVGVVEEEGYG